MRDASSTHLKVQELCDCFATTDPLKEMSKMIRETDEDEAALKWIALAVLHGINSNASEVSISTVGGDKVRVTAEYKKAELPTPGSLIGMKAIKAIRSIIHLNEGKTTLALGIRNNSIDLNITSRQEGDDDKITIVFP
jgi:hypothetical protein